MTVTISIVTLAKQIVLLHMEIHFIDSSKHVNCAEKPSCLYVDEFVFKMIDGILERIICMMSYRKLKKYMKLPLLWFEGPKSRLDW